MKITDVRDLLAEIENEKDDPEAAHVIEDELYTRVLRAIAAGKTRRPRTLAALALGAEKIDFPRW